MEKNKEFGWFFELEKEVKTALNTEPQAKTAEKNTKVFLKHHYHFKFPILSACEVWHYLNILHIIKWEHHSRL